MAGKAKEVDPTQNNQAGNLTPWEVAEFKEAFALFDLNKNGTIEPEELQEIMSKLGWDCTEAEIQDMVSVADEHGTGRIGLQ